MTIEEKNNIDIQTIKEVFAKVEFLKDRWCDLDLDFPDEIMSQVPDFLNWTYSKLGVALRILPEPQLKIISAVYGANETWMNVKSILENNIIDDCLEMDINNITMKRDICPGIVKSIKIEYILNDKNEFLEAQEGTRINLEDKVIESI